MRLTTNQAYNLGVVVGTIFGFQVGALYQKTKDTREIQKIWPVTKELLDWVPTGAVEMTHDEFLQEYMEKVKFINLAIEAS